VSAVKKVPYKWALDHDQDDKTFKGWLCEPCNTGIGKLGDDFPSIVNAMNYFLSRPNHKSSILDKEIPVV
jgi:hypothetical protein